jgi:hypothetical protein
MEEGRPSASGVTGKTEDITLRLQVAGCIKDGWKTASLGRPLRSDEGRCKYRGKREDENKSQISSRKSQVISRFVGRISLNFPNFQFAREATRHRKLFEHKFFNPFAVSGRQLRQVP